jgi:hypothetical protein
MSDKIPTPESLLIGAVKFVKQVPPKTRGGPRCVLSTNARGYAELRFNVPQLEALPALAATERCAVFLAADKPALALFPATDGVKLRPEKGGARKASGLAFRALGAKYRRITYKVEAIDSPRKGWLLTAVESERRESKV